MRVACNCGLLTQQLQDSLQTRCISGLSIARSRTTVLRSPAHLRKNAGIWQLERQRCHGNMSVRASSSDADVTTSSLSEVAALDKLIDLLRGANGHQQLTQLVAENLLAFDQKFWIRLASRSDTAQSTAEKENLTNLANVRRHPPFLPWNA